MWWHTQIALPQILSSSQFCVRYPLIISSPQYPVTTFCECYLPTVCHQPIFPQAVLDSFILMGKSKRSWNVIVTNLVTGTGKLERNGLVAQKRAWLKMEQTQKRIVQGMLKAAMLSLLVNMNPTTRHISWSSSRPWGTPKQWLCPHLWQSRWLGGWPCDGRHWAVSGWGTHKWTTSGGDIVTPVMVEWQILDPYWVTLWKLLMWLPQAMYVVSHAKGTSLSQTINFGSHLSFFCGALTSLSHLPNFFCVSGTHYGLALLLHSHDLALCPCLSVEVATWASYFGQQTIFSVI